MASTASSKKGKKKKGQTVNLNDFLSGGTNNAPDGKTVVTLKSQTSWADAMEDADGEDDDFLGPTEQIALPTAPRAARQEIDLSQLPDSPPYKAYVGNLSYDVDEEALGKFFAELKVNSVRLIRDNGRMKGYGYVEFDDKQSLIEALKATGQTLMARKIKVDLATQSNRDGFGGDRERDGRGGSQISGEGDADDDWRGSAAANKSSYDTGSYGRHRDNGYGRDRDDRDGGRYGQRRGYDDRDGGYGPPRDRYGGASEADTASSWSRGPPRSMASDDRNGGYSRRGYEEPSRRGYEESSRRGYDDRGSYGRRGGYDERDSGYGRRDGRYNDYNGASRRGGGAYWEGGHDRYGSDHRHSSYNRNNVRYDDRASEAPKERPRLQLAPRSKPAESDDTVSSSTDAPKPSIFGSAKPVDTAAKEREIEERLKKREQETRPPRDSRDSRDSGSSFASRDIRTNVERRVFNTGSEPDSSKPPTKPTSEQPKKSSASVFGSAKPVDTAAREREIEERLRKERESTSVSAADSASERKSDYREAHKDGPRPNAWSRGAPNTSSERANHRAHREKKERALPTSIDEMPVYKETQSKDFSDANIYAGLLGSDGEDEQHD